MRVPLRHFRVSREPYIEVDGARLRLWLPAIFADRQAWDLDVTDVVLVDPRSVSNDDTGEGWAFQRRVEIPYAATTDHRVAPNLTLLFTTPQRVPPLKLNGAEKISLSYFRSRSEAGVQVDGVRLRAEDPVAAIQALTAEGVRKVDRPVAWLRQHRPVTQDPALVQVAQARRRDLRRMIWVFFAAPIVLTVMLIQGGGELSTWELIAMGVAAPLIWVLSAWVLRRAGRPLGGGPDA